MTYFIYVLICLIWGSTWIAIKIGLSQAPPFYTSSLRFLLSVIILATIVALKKYPYPKGFKNLFLMGIPGLFMYGISYALVYFSEMYIDSSLAAVLFGSFPFFVALFSIKILKAEKLNTLRLAGAVYRSHRGYPDIIRLLSELGGYLSRHPFTSWRDRFGGIWHDSSQEKILR